MRLVRVSPRYLRQAIRVGAPPGSVASGDAARTMRQLATADTLPLPGDVRAAMPPTGVAYVRRVLGRNLWLWYAFSDTTLSVLTLASTPPVPLD